MWLRPRWPLTLELAHHREMLVKPITTLIGDRDYVSPTARVVQYKADKLLESALAVDGLSQTYIECNDLETVLLAETKDHATGTCCRTSRNRHRAI